MQQKARWGNQDAANFQPLHTQPWPFMTREYLDNHSPSRCKKITKEVERQRAFSCNDLIYESGTVNTAKRLALARFVLSSCMMAALLLVSRKPCSLQERP